MQTLLYSTKKICKKIGCRSAIITVVHYVKYAEEAIYNRFSTIVKACRLLVELKIQGDTNDRDL